MTNRNDTIKAMVILNKYNMPDNCSKNTGDYKIYYSTNLVYVGKIGADYNSIINIETDFFKKLLDFSTEKEFVSFSNDTLNNIIDKYLKLKAFL